jgi:tetratricopeptide (TPR) repeat protein
MRNEANTFYAIANLNKSIELNSTVIKLIENRKKLFIDLLEKNNFLKKQKNIAENKPENSDLITQFDFSKSKTSDILTNCFNNRGNSYLRNNNFKEAINDFNAVLKRDAKNVKAFFRRGVAYFNLQVYKNSLRDLNQALALSGSEAEKVSIKAQIEKTINIINSLVKNYRNKSEKYEISQDTEFRRAILKDIDEDLVSSIKEENKDTLEKQEEKDEEARKQKNGIFLDINS